MLINVKTQLKMQIENKSIDFDVLMRNVKAILALPANQSDIDKISYEHGTCNFALLAKFKERSAIGFAYTDKAENKRMKLLLYKAQISGEKQYRRLLAEGMQIENINAADEADKDETPMWVDRKWYRMNKNGKVYRWLGKKSYDVTSPDNKQYILKDISNGVIDKYPEEKVLDKAHFVEAVPEYEKEKIIYKELI